MVLKAPVEVTEKEEKGEEIYWSRDKERANLFKTLFGNLNSNSHSLSV